MEKKTYIKVKKYLWRLTINISPRKLLCWVFKVTGFGATENRDLRRTVANSQYTDGASSESSTKLLELEVRCIKVIPLLNLWSRLRGCLR